MASALRQRGNRTRRGEKLKAEIHHMDLNLTSRSERYIGGLCFATSVLGSVRERAHSPHIYAWLRYKGETTACVVSRTARRLIVSIAIMLMSNLSKITQKSELTP